MGLVSNGMAFLMSRPAVTNLLMAGGPKDMNGGSSGWDPKKGVDRVNDTMNYIVPILILIIGGVATVAGVYKIVTGLISHGKGQPTSWPVAIILLVVGLALLFTGIGALNGASASNTINTTLGFN